jgi:hypothetical protein
MHKKLWIGKETTTEDIVSNETREYSHCSKHNAVLTME